MPTVAIVEGIKIQFYWDDHPPSHFHVEYGDYRAQIAISSLRILNGYIPKAQHRKIVAWARSRKSELLGMWIKCQSDLHPGKFE